MPALSRAVATTGPAIPPPMTSAVRTLDVAAVDMGFSPGCGVRRSFLCRDHAREPSYPLVATSWPGFVSCGHRFESVGRGWLRAAAPGPRRRCWRTAPGPLRVL